MNRHFIFGFTILIFISISSQAAFFAVDKTFEGSDANLGDGVCMKVGGGCTLRAAIEEANALPGEDTIVVPSDMGTYMLNLGDLFVTSKITITNATSTPFIIDANFNHRIFTIENGGELSLFNAILTNGLAEEQHGGAVSLDLGAIFKVEEVIFLNNEARLGGAIASFGQVQITNSYLKNNIASSELNLETKGSAILNRGFLILDSSTVSYNGSISFAAESILSDGLFDGETPAAVWIINSTIANNNGGTGINLIDSQTHISQSTVANNTGRGINFNKNEHANYTNEIQLVIDNSLIVNNAIGDCFGLAGANPLNVDITDNSNASSDESCGFVGLNDIENIADPFFGPLSDWGGFAPTLMLKKDSDAVDGGGGSCTDSDQRGSQRPIDGDNDFILACDMGAIEYNPLTDPIFEECQDSQNQDVIFMNGFDCIVP